MLSSIKHQNDVIFVNPFTPDILVDFSISELGHMHCCKKGLS